jgi:hypothetical protein
LVRDFADLAEDLVAEGGLVIARAHVRFVELIGIVPKVLVPFAVHGKPGGVDNPLVPDLELPEAQILIKKEVIRERLVERAFPILFAAEIQEAPDRGPDLAGRTLK